MAHIFIAQEDHWPLVREIRLRSLSTDPEAFGSTWDRESAFDDKTWKKRMTTTTWFLATEENTPVGVVCSRHEDDAPASELELQAMWVAPESRGHHTSQELVEAVIDWAAEQGAETLGLWVSPKNPAAQHIYELTGFDDTGERYSINEEEPETDWIKMARALNS